jgi:glycosyltransferase involved in cell wall biosynthesis
MCFVLSDALRIALIAPPWYPIPPKGYGGIELVVHLLHQELHSMGHHVTVLGAEGSGPGVEVLAPSEWSIDLGTPVQPVREATYLLRAFDRLARGEFDVIHDHVGAVGLLALGACGPAEVKVHTIHGPISESMATLYRQVQDRVRLVAISASQAVTARDVAIAGVVYNAVPVDVPVQTHKDSYLLELARITPDKGQHLAIEVAHRTGRPLVLAGKVERTPEGERYFREKIAPHLGDQIRYIPNVAGREKQDLIGRAAAGVFPLQWPEPFGLAMVECMVTGTPVVAFGVGAAPELIEPRVTGFIARDVDQMVAAIALLDEIDPIDCAAEARRRFSPRRMAEGYLDVYRQGRVMPELEWEIIEKAPPPPRPASPSPAREWDDQPDEE